MPVDNIQEEFGGEPVAAEGREETGAHLGAYGIDEEYKAEIAQQGQHRGVHGKTQVAEQYAGEHHGGYAEAQAEEADAARGQAQG